MSNRVTPDQVAFVSINGQNVRATSWKPSGDDSTAHLVVISRGSRDVELLDSLLQASPLRIAVEGEPERTASVTGVDRRAFGEGQGAITRFGIDFAFGEVADVPSQPAPKTLEDRIAAMEAEVANLKARLATITSE